MYYAFDICPKCKDKLIGRKQGKDDAEEFEKYSGVRCPKCGNRLVLACANDKERDDTRYKIILKGITNREKNENQCVKALMQIGNFDADTALEKLNTEDSLIFEGDFSHTVLTMIRLDDAGHFAYTEIPKIPMTKYISFDICPECGCETIEKEEAYELADYIKTGIYCENCGEWLMYCAVCKLNLDETSYSLVFSLEGVRDQEKEKLWEIIDSSDKTILEDQIVLCDKAWPIRNILQRLEAFGIGYTVDPPFPYEIGEFRELDEDLLNEILKFSAQVEEKVLKNEDSEQKEV